MFDSFRAVTVAHEDPSQAEMGPGGVIVDLDGLLIHFRGSVKVFILLQELADLNIDLKVIMVRLYRLSVVLEGSIDVLLILHNCSVALKLEDEMLVPVLVDSLNFKEALFSLSVLFLICIEFGHAKVGPAVPRVVLDKGHALGHGPVVVMHLTVLLEYARGHYRMTGGGSSLG